MTEVKAGPKLEMVPLPAIVRPAADVVARRLGDSAVLVRLAANHIYELNPTGARVWDLVGAGTPVSAMLDTLTGEFDASADTIRTEVGDLLRRLLAEGRVVADTQDGV